VAHDEDLLDLPVHLEADADGVEVLVVVELAEPDLPRGAVEGAELDVDAVGVEVVVQEVALQNGAGSGAAFESYPLLGAVLDEAVLDPDVPAVAGALNVEAVALRLVDVDPVHVPVGDAVQVDDVLVPGGGVEGHVVEAAEVDGARGVYVYAVGAVRDIELYHGAPVEVVPAHPRAVDVHGLLLVHDPARGLGDLPLRKPHGSALVEKHVLDGQLYVTRGLLPDVASGVDYPRAVTDEANC